MAKMANGILIFVMALIMIGLSACGGSNSLPSSNSSSTPSPVSTSSLTPQLSPSAAPVETPIPALNITQASASDIPDTQVFVTYSSSAAGYQLDTPEGWARTTSGTDVTFIDKLNGLQVAITNASSAPTVASVNANQVVALEQTGRAIRDVTVKSVNLPVGPAILIVYTSNSEPDPVTGKQVRQENNRYLFYKNGKLVALTVWAPIGADNVDQWARISRSFKWV